MFTRLTQSALLATIALLAGCTTVTSNNIREVGEHQ